MLALALIVCEWESTTSRNTWRHPGERDRRYLTALIGWGYKPSDVEQLVLVDTTQAETTDPEVPDKDIQQVEDADRGGIVPHRPKSLWVSLSSPIRSIP